MSFQLAKFTRNDLIAVLTKMEFKSFANIREAAPWLCDFIKQNRVKLHVDGITFSFDVTIENGSIISKFQHISVNGSDVSEEKLELISPANLYFNVPPMERTLSMDFKQFKKLQHVGFFDTDEDDVYAIFNKLYEENIPQKASLYVRNYHKGRKHTRRSCFFEHPILHKVWDLNIESSVCRRPDLSFLLSNHGEVKLKITRIPDTSVVIKAIQLICDGTNNTKLIGFFFEDRDVETIMAVVDGLPGKSAWSWKRDPESSFKDQAATNFAAKFSFWSIPMAGGKVGGLACEMDGSSFIFKVSDSDEEYLETVTTDPNFYRYNLQRY